VSRLKPPFNPYVQQRKSAKKESDIQDHIEFSDSVGEDGKDDALKYSANKDLLEIQDGIAFSDSDEEGF